ncbi:MAG: hypothetical protein C5B50_05175 [Verrucomicrobia bacterium]|nr:MAG: hypothetical protein C5B50_05175 [Verrucomicrobiota bacterium]
MQRMPATLFFQPPMECKEVKYVDRLPRGADWQYEIKFDGYRCLAIKQKNEVELYSRRGHPFNQFLSLNKALLEQPPKSFILDGEIVALDSVSFVLVDTLESLSLENTREEICSAELGMAPAAA